MILLREQAQLLTQATEGVLQGEVATQSTTSTIYHELWVIVPASTRA